MTTAVLRSENRLVTTLLAELIRDAEVEDGTNPRGIHFGSKHGGAWCRAIWLPYYAATPSGAEITTTDDIHASDAATRAVARRLPPSDGIVWAEAGDPVFDPPLAAIRNDPDGGRP